MGFGKLKKIKELFKRPPLIVGLPNPNAVSKEEFQRRIDKINEINKKIKEDFMKKNLLH